MKYLTLIETDTYKLNIDSKGQYYRLDKILNTIMYLTDLQAKGMMLIRLDNV